jgi:hypothetical protein
VLPRRADHSADHATARLLHQRSPGADVLQHRSNWGCRNDVPITVNRRTANHGKPVNKLSIGHSLLLFRPELPAMQQGRERGKGKRVVTLNSPCCCWSTTILVGNKGLWVGAKRGSRGDHPRYRMIFGIMDEPRYQAVAGFRVFTHACRLDAS